MNAINPASDFAPANDKDACGVGFVASTRAQASHAIVQKGLEAIASVQHRGGVGADGKTGDGAGIKISLDQDFFKSEYGKENSTDLNGRDVAVGQFFLPQNSEEERLAIEAIVTNVLEGEFGFSDTQWRDTPLNIDVLGEGAKASLPRQKQLIIPAQEGQSAEAFEKKLYIARRVIEKRVADEGLAGPASETFYIPSMSSNTIVYKGLSLATDLGDLYTDLKNPELKSTYAAFHQRFSTNTTPVWERAHPYRFLAHNGEINSLQGNVNNISRLDNLIREAYGEDADHILPIIQPGGSDSANVDNVIEALSLAGYSLPEIKTILVPPAFQHDTSIPDSERQMYEYISAVTGPWDGPATLAMSDAKQLVLGGDRNGLRPVRYVIDETNGLIVAGSEEGMVEIDPAHITKRGNLEPGELLGIDIENGGVQYDQELKQQAVVGLEEKLNIEEALKHIKKLEKADLAAPRDLNDGSLLERQALFGYTQETIDMLITPMAKDGKEPLGSMSDDAQPAYLTDKSIYRPLSHYFKQKFAQVTNPPIDPIREENVTSLITTLGSFNIGGDASQQKDLVQLDSPVLSNATFAKVKDQLGDDVVEIDATFNAGASEFGMLDRIEEIKSQARDAALKGQHIILTDEHASADRVQIPMLLVASAVHSELIDSSARGRTSLNVRSSEAADPHDFATLIGMGADTVNAYLTEETILAAERNGKLDGVDADKAVANYTKAIDAGVLKIMSKMGISDVNSYRGARLFEALGLSDEFVGDYFPGVPTPISGLGVYHLQERIIAQHERGLGADTLEKGGFIRLRKDQLPHAIDKWKADLLQKSVHQDDPAESYETYQQYARFIDHQANKNPIYVRDLMGFDHSNANQPVSVDDVEPVEEVMKRLMTGAMSMGSISPEAHETLAIALNRIGGKSNTGEGGEDPQRIWDEERRSKIKQVASGRFGVTTDYLSSADEIEIKVAQGAKPGEGGQLMSGKVSVEIAKLRHCEPGTTLISPPPHHDIYSIEDLAQLIFDMKEVNPDAKVRVKLVASSGVDTIAVGVAKTGADVIHIAGGRGGTGASPQTSITHAGQEFETALAKTHQALTKEGFRDKVRLTTDGSLRTGKDIVMASMMGAEEFGFGLQALIAEGCGLVRKCQTGECPVGVATGREDLRANFTGTPEGVERMFRNIAQDVRENLALLGFTSLDQVIGRTDLLKQEKAQNLGVDLTGILPFMGGEAERKYYVDGPRSEYRNPLNPNFISLDRDWVSAQGDAIKAGNNVVINHEVTNQHRNVGTRISGEIAREYKGRADASTQFATLNLTGIAGQSLGAFARSGVDIRLEGVANDYVGKGLSGGSISIRPEAVSSVSQASQDNIIIGNTCLYGATSGDLFAAGRAGNRFGVRLSGAKTVVEGAGDSALEYMTGGQAVILGSVGKNFGAGMSGGEAFVYDPDDALKSKANKDVAEKIERLDGASDKADALRERIAEHIRETGSYYAQALLDDWDNAVHHFKRVAPANSNEAAPVLDVAKG
ncbi:MAG: glutamate synthase large subunit [Bdellovibrionales bacterium]